MCNQERILAGEEGPMEQRLRRVRRLLVGIGVAEQVVAKKTKFRKGGQAVEELSGRGGEEVTYRKIHLQLNGAREARKAKKLTNCPAKKESVSDRTIPHQIELRISEIGKEANRKRKLKSLLRDQIFVDSLCRLQAESVTGEETVTGTMEIAIEKRTNDGG